MGRRCGSMSSWGPGTPSGGGARAASSPISLPDPDLGACILFPGMWTRTASAPSVGRGCGCYPFGILLQYKSSISFYVIQNLSYFKETDIWSNFLCGVCSWFFLNARTFGDVLSHEPGNFIDSLDPSLPSPREYYKVLSSVSKMSLDISICFIDEKSKTQSLRTSPLWQLCSKDKTEDSQLSALQSKDLSTSPTYAQELQTMH